MSRRGDASRLPLWLRFILESHARLAVDQWVSAGRTNYPYRPTLLIVSRALDHSQVGPGPSQIGMLAYRRTDPNLLTERHHAINIEPAPDQENDERNDVVFQKSEEELLDYQ